MALKLLVVDDEVDVLKMIKNIIEPLGCEVLLLADSREAAKRVEKEKFDGVFLDARMPHLDGFELARCTRASSLNRGAPIVMLTAMNDLSTMRRAFEAGITFFLAKPFDNEKLYSLFKIMRGAMLREKRRHARLPFRTPLTCWVGERSFPSCSLNMGESGMLLEFSGGLAEGMIVDLEFTLPQAKKSLKLRAKVIRREPPDRMALGFLELTTEDQQAIQAFIAGGIKE
jgi:CheY-like chemotaxis protein